MKARVFIIAVGLLVSALVLTVGEPEGDEQNVAPTIDTKIAATEIVSEPAIDSGPSIARPRTAPRSEIDEYERRLASHQRVRAYFANPEVIDASQRVSYARDLSKEITAYETRGELSAAEALLLKRELIRTSVPNATEQREQLQSLEREYDLASQRSAAATDHPDPQFELYKIRENQIVSHIMQMDTIPDGLTRDEYLRQRLQAEREKIFAQAN